MVGNHIIHMSFYYELLNIKQKLKNKSACLLLLNSYTTTITHFGKNVKWFLCLFINSAKIFGNPFIIKLKFMFIYGINLSIRVRARDFKVWCKPSGGKTWAKKNFLFIYFSFSINPTLKTCRDFWHDFFNSLANNEKSGWALSLIYYLF